MKLRFYYRACGAADRGRLRLELIRRIGRMWAGAVHPIIVFKDT